MKVFIADDSPVMREHLNATLSGFKKIEIIGEAADAIEAVKSIKKLKPDVVILDIRMPGGGGIHVLKAIKKNKVSPVVVVFTNYPYPQYRNKCMEEGAEFFFDKVSETGRMIETIERLVNMFSAPKSSIQAKKDIC
ncbi:MAG TPA: response regulator transcription factor [archaeon]|nr:response regulator transcription factor [archaeon]